MSMNQFTSEKLLLNIRHALLHRTNGSCIFIFRPTNAENKLWHQKVEMQLAKDNPSKPGANPYHIPVVKVENISPEPGNFNWRDYYEFILLTLSDDTEDTCCGE